MGEAIPAQGVEKQEKLGQPSFAGAEFGRFQFIAFTNELEKSLNLINSGE
jgi:hypothetical protein